MKKLFSKLGSILTAIRVGFLNVITFLLVMYVVFAIVAMVSERPSQISPSDRVLIIAPEGVIVDQEVFPTDFSFPYYLDNPRERYYQTRDVVKLLRGAAEDENLAGVLVDFSNVAFAGVSTALRLSEELAAIRESGKPVIAYSEYLGTGAYLMAMQADEIYVNNAGAVSISGLGGYREYTRELTEKLKINIHNYSQGDFKSAVEGLTRDSMSDSDKLQLREIFDPMWQTIKQRMAEARGIDPQVFQVFADEHSLALVGDGGFDGLRIAQEQGLIDGVKSRTEFRAYMIERFGMDEEAGYDTYPHIVNDDYFFQLEDDLKSTSDEVAVVFVQGVIQPGPQGPGVAGADDIAHLLREAHESENTRALVMRVNSPGGSIIASDIIAEELSMARDKGLPVYVSMGDVAASGGVWVSMPADKIYAEPTTITGSIGVAVAFPTFENLLDYIGVNIDGVTTSDRAGWSVYQGVDKSLDAFFARWAGSAYEQFISNVAVSRNRDPEYIRSIAGGRVWLADRAQELGLIDELGGMEDTIEAAAAAASLVDYRVNYVVMHVPPHIAFLQQFSLGISEKVLPSYGAFGRRMEKLFEMLEGIDRPTATVMCSECMVELLQ